jgi:hypothetical protein
MDPSWRFADKEISVNREEGGVDLDKEISSREIIVRMSNEIR